MSTLICIVCPNGCRLQINTTGEDIEVLGAKCKKGIEYAIAEMTAPKRSVTSTVRTVFPHAPILPVRTDDDIPKDKIFDLMDLLRSFILKDKVKRGQTIIENIFDTGVNIIATSDMLYKEDYNNEE